MSNSSALQWLPAWPVVPLRLWLTAIGVGLAILSLVFKKEIWTYHRPAEIWSWAMLVMLLQAGGAQVIWLLLCWPDNYYGPRWMQLLLRGITLVAGIGIAILMFLLFIVSGSFAIALLFK